MSILPVGIMQETANTSTTSGKNVVDKNEFLMLLVTQLQNQDPLNPMDYTEFTSQMAQFSSLEQLQNLNTNIEKLQGYQNALFNESIVPLIGKTVGTYDNGLEYKGDDTCELSFNLDSSASAVYASIYNSQGELVREINEVGSYDQGFNTITWDGKDNNGNALDAGNYSFEVQAVNFGLTYNGTPIHKFKISGVQYINARPYLISGENQIDINNVISVSEN